MILIHVNNSISSTWVEILKHLDDPSTILNRARGWLKPTGFLIATTPNARSLHRRVGVYMGLLNGLNDLSETDRALEISVITIWLLSAYYLRAAALRS